MLRINQFGLKAGDNGISVLIDAPHCRRATGVQSPSLCHWHAPGLLYRICGYNDCPVEELGAGKVATVRRFDSCDVHSID